MVDLVRKYPRVFWFMVGLLVSILLGSTSAFWANKTIEEYKELNSLVIEEYRTKTIEQTAKIDTLTTENRSLRQRSSTYKIVKPDGTIEERTSAESESEEALSTSVKEEYRTKVREEINTLHREYNEKINKITSERKKLLIQAGVAHDKRYHLGISYGFSGPWEIGAGALFPVPAYILNIGVRL